jgi:hypothetical protein
MPCSGKWTGTTPTSSSDVGLEPVGEHCEDGQVDRDVLVLAMVAIVLEALLHAAGRAAAFRAPGGRRR